MRKLIIKRRKTIVASLMNVKIYIGDDENCYCTVKVYSPLKGNPFVWDKV